LIEEKALMEQLTLEPDMLCSCQSPLFRMRT